MIDSVNHQTRSRPSSAATAATNARPQTNADREQLVHRIVQRIQARLPGRIRQLSIYATENAIVLAGHCSTYYTKQVAQHTAMGVLEYERLINNIDVDLPK